MSDASSMPAKAVDVIAAGTLVSTLLGWLPTILSIIVSILLIIHYSIVIYESQTYKNFYRWFRGKRSTGHHH